MQTLQFNTVYICGVFNAHAQSTSGIVNLKGSLRWCWQNMRTFGRQVSDHSFVLGTDTEYTAQKYYQARIQIVKTTNWISLSAAAQQQISNFHD